MNKQIIVRHQNVGFNFSFQQGALVLNCLLTYLCGGWGAGGLDRFRSQDVCLDKGPLWPNYSKSPIFYLQEFCFSVKFGKIFKIANNEKSLQPFFGEFDF